MSSKSPPTKINPYASSREAEPAGPPPSRGSLLVIFLTVFIDLLGFGMALIGAAFGLGFTFGPLLGAAALIFSHDVGTSPWPGYAAALLSGIALMLAIFLLPESLRPGSQHAGHAIVDWRAWYDAFVTPSVPALLATAFASVVSFGAFETTLSLLLV